MAAEKIVIQEFENGTNSVHIPILTEEEKAIRMKHLKKSVERFAKAIIKQGVNIDEV